MDYWEKLEETNAYVMGTNAFVDSCLDGSANGDGLGDSSDDGVGSVDDDISGDNEGDGDSLGDGDGEDGIEYIDED